MDLNSLSDAELQLVAAGKPIPRGGGSSPAIDLHSLSDADLEAVAAGKPIKQGQSSDQGQQDQIIQEMHPDISFADRAIAKNFANDEEGQVKYLKGKYPGLDIKLSPDRQVLARKPGETAYKTLDPNNGVLESLNPFRAETWKDLADVGYDALSGAGTTAASGAAGLAGAAAGGIGALPAAALVGSAASTSLEGLRQLAGNALGVNDGADYANLAAAAGSGALAPVLLGTGAGTKAIANEALKTGLQGPELQAALKELANSQRGVVGMGVDKFVKPGLAKVGGLLSGTSDSSLNVLGKNLPKFDQMTKSPTGVLDFIDNTGKSVDGKFAKAKASAWSEFQNAIGDRNDEASVDLAPLKEKFQAAIADAKDRAKTGTDASKDLVNRLESAYDNHLRYDATEKVPITVNKSTGLDEYGRENIQPVTEMVDQPVRKELDKLSPKQAVDLEKQLSELAGFNNLDSRQVTGNRFSNGMSADDKHLQMVAGDLKKTLGSSIEQVLPSNAIPAKRRYGELLNLQKSIEALTGNPRQAFTNLRNADVSSNITNMQQFRKIDDAIGTNLVNRAKLAEAVDLFGPGRKSWFHGGHMSKVPAAAAGGLAGAYLGSDSGSRYPGILAGSGLGLLLGGPTAMKTYIRAGIKGGALNQALAPLRVGAGKALINEGINSSPWANMRSTP